MVSNVTHGTFTLARTFTAQPHQVFEAWANPNLKCRWFAERELFREVSHTLDFRVGGAETLVGLQRGGRRFENRAVYHIISPSRRVAFSYTIAFDDAPVSVSLATLEMQPHESGTQLLFTEQAAFLDLEHTAAGRKSGWAWLLSRLGEVACEVPRRFD